MAAGVSYNQPEQEYRRNPAHAQSHVKHILKSPAHYQAALKQPWSPTLTMHVGSAVHCLVLEGQQEFDSRFVLKPEGLSLTTKEGKKWKAEQKGKTVLSASDQHRSWHAVHGMTASVRRLPWFDPEQRNYYRYNEVSLYFESDGLSCKCRLDRLLLFHEQAVIVDLKSTESVAPAAFTKTIFGDLNYLFQAAWYSEAVEAVYGVKADFVFAAVERKPPYNCRVFELSVDAMREGFRQTAAARRKLLECQQSGVWELPPVEAVPLELPGWYRSPLEGGELESTSGDGGYTEEEGLF